MTRILIGGIGNIFMGDDGFGSVVAQRLSQRTLAPEIDVVDFGIRGLDLSYALVDGYHGVILIDAVDRGGVPGTVYRIEPDLDSPTTANTYRPMFSPHAMDPVTVLRFAASLGTVCPRVLLIGCQPETLNDDEGRMDLSEPVEAAIPVVITEVQRIAAEWSTQRLRPVSPMKLQA
ncbi:hydrogenase maturation protease [Marinobacter caseinilyticus]|uniref:hydrogenase maturation protease n=1 Tax=Marinobacter caseinilyticus TaxID=2692195 RepID=UPI00140E1C39|nr:hydrogenase maturation protease [Marinobacter caseinilyticus]